MSKPDEVTSEMCKKASLLIWRQQGQLRERMEAERNFNLKPLSSLPVDEALETLAQRTRKPKLVYLPSEDVPEKWMANIHMVAYFWLEQGFTSASMLVGGNRSGFREKIELELAKVEQAKRAIEKLDLNFLPHRLNLLTPDRLSKSLGNHGASQYGLYVDLVGRLANGLDQLVQLEDILKTNLMAVISTGTNRPLNFQKFIFALTIARLWEKLTGECAKGNAEGPFGRFLIDCWNSGFGDREVDNNFSNILRNKDFYKR